MLGKRQETSLQKENIYVVDPDRDKLMKFNKNGDSLAQWTIDNPRDIVIDSQDNIYINFSFNLAIAKFDTNGIIVDSIRLSEEIGKLIIGINGNIFFPDNSGKINEYNSNLSFINSSEIIFKGNKMTSIIGIDNVGNLYFKRNVMIGQSSYNRIYIFNSGGQFLAKFGFFYYLNDIEFLNSTVYIVDFNSDPWLPQIQIYSIPF